MRSAYIRKLFIFFWQKLWVVRKKSLPLRCQKKEKSTGLWCNGNTADSGPAFPGSSPGSPTQEEDAVASSSCVYP